MKAQEDIERQLAAAQDAWETSPAPELWERLEQRLDAQLPTQGAKAPRRWPFRIVMIALLATAGFGIWALLPTGKAAQVSQGKAFVGHETSFHPQMPLAAGQPMHIDEVDVQNIAASLDPNAAPALAAARIPQPTGLSSSPASPSYNTNGFLQVNGNSAQAPIANLMPLTNWASTGLVVSNSMGNPIDTVSSLRQFRNLVSPQDNAYLQINPSRNQMNFNYAGATPVDNQQNLQHLKWLLGSWKTQGSSGGAMEDWRQKDDFTLIGRGYFVVNGDTVVTEEMRIEQRGPDTYFILLKDQNHKSMKFRLRSSQPNELIFQNAVSKEEDELVLRNLPATNELERVLQPSPTRSTETSSKPDFYPSKSKQVLQRSRRP